MTMTHELASDDIERLQQTIAGQRDHIRRLEDRNRAQASMIATRDGVIANMNAKIVLYRCERDELRQDLEAALDKVRELKGLMNA